MGRSRKEKLMSYKGKMQGGSGQMAKAGKSGKTCMPDGGKLIERNLMGVNPLKEQFEPQGMDAVRQRAKMAGQPG